MPMNTAYAAQEPGRIEVDSLRGAALVEFGAPWCPHCQAVQPLLAAAFTKYPAVSHLKIEDGRGKPLGRSFHVKLWPTLIFIKDGQEVQRLVRPADLEEIERAFAKLD